MLHTKDCRQLEQSCRKGTGMEQNQLKVNNYKTTAKTEQLMNSHPNLKSAPSMNQNQKGEEPGAMTKQGSSYGAFNKCAPDNNIFWEERSNPLSSKGD